MNRFTKALAVLAVTGTSAIVGIGAQASAAEPTIEEFGGFTAAASPCEVEFDRNGTLWTELVGANAIGRVNTDTGAVKQFSLPTAGGIPGGMELGPDGGIWFPEVVGNQIVRLDPDTGQMKEFPIPWANFLGKYGAYASDDVTFGRDGALYFTSISTSAIGRMDIKTGKMTQISIPSKPSGPAIVQLGPGNTVIFGGIFSNKIAVLDTDTQKIREYSVPSGPTQGVTTGPDGAVWYSAPLAQELGRIDLKTGDIQVINLLKARGPKLPISPGSPLLTPTTLRTGSDGKIYFGEGGLLFPSFGNKIGVYDPQNGHLDEIETPSPLSTPCDQNAQKPGELWSGFFTSNKVGRIKIPALPQYSYCRQVACPSSVPTAPPSTAAKKTKKSKKKATRKRITRKNKR